MKTFDIKLIKPNLPFTIRHQNMTLPSIGMFLNKKYGYTIDFDVYLETLGINLQRPFVWSETQKQEFVLSLLKGINIPQFAVVIHVDDFSSGNDRIFKIIDGKQRLSTLFSFVKNDFPIPCGNDSFYFNELPEKVKDDILRWEGQGQIAYSYVDKKISDFGLIQWFWLLNFAGTQQEKEHIELLKSKL